MKSREGDELSNPFILTRSSAYNSFKHKAPGVVSFLSKAAKNRVQLNKVGLYAVNLLYKDIRRQGVAGSSITMMRQVHRIPALINQAFPGYAESGLLHLILKEGDHVREE